MIGVLLITHGRLGAHFVDTLTGMLGDLALPTETLEIHRNDDPEPLVERATQVIANLDSGDGVLLVTDAFGSTPSNIANHAHTAATRTNTRVVTGINLPMLIRVYNYPKLALDVAAESAIEGGRNGIITCDSLST